MIKYDDDKEPDGIDESDKQAEDMDHDQPSAHNEVHFLFATILKYY